MGTIVLLIAFIIEVILAAVCLATKSRQEKTRGAIRIGGLAVFFFLLLSSVIQWSFRWYGLAVLLFILAAIETVTLFRRNRPEKEYHPKQVVSRTILMLLLYFLAVIPALVFPQYKMPETTGKYPVASVQYTYTDDSRIEEYTRTGENRKVNVEIWYPGNAEGIYPLVLFSHGALGIQSSNLSLYRELASHGYVVVSIAHPYQSFWTSGENGQVTFLNLDYLMEIQKEDAKTDKWQSYVYYQKWMNIRTGDINFVIDTVVKNAKGGIGGVYSLVDTEKIGVMGHSLGGSAALCLGRQRSDVDAVIALESPFLCDIEGVEKGEFVFTHETYPVPVLNVYSDASWEHLSEWAQYAANNALLSGTQKTASNVHINGAGHFSLTDLALSSPLIAWMLEGEKPTRNSEECLQIIEKVVLKFYDAYLKNKGELTRYSDE